MRRSLLLTACSLLLLPGRGSLMCSDYTCRGFSFAYPEGWAVKGQASGMDGDWVTIANGQDGVKVQLLTNRKELRFTGPDGSRIAYPRKWSVGIIADRFLKQEKSARKSLMLVKGSYQDSTLGERATVAVQYLDAEAGQRRYHFFIDDPRGAIVVQAWTALEGSLVPAQAALKQVTGSIKFATE
jgi:hypothetical protein